MIPAYVGITRFNIELFQQSVFFGYLFQAGHGLLQKVIVNAVHEAEIAVNAESHARDGNWQILDSYLKTSIKKQAENYLQRK